MNPECTGRNVCTPCPGHIALHLDRLPLQLVRQCTQYLHDPPTGGRKGDTVHMQVAYERLLRSSTSGPIRSCLAACPLLSTDTGPISSSEVWALRRRFRFHVTRLGHFSSWLGSGTRMPSGAAWKAMGARRRPEAGGIPRLSCSYISSETPPSTPSITSPPRCSSQPAHAQVSPDQRSFLSRPLSFQYMSSLLLNKHADRQEAYKHNSRGSCPTSHSFSLLQQSTLGTKSQVDLRFIT